MSGDRQSALEAMRQLQRRAYASPWLVAVIYAQLNDKDRAFAWLEKAYEGREHDLAFAGVWPLFDNLRAGPSLPRPAPARGTGAMRLPGAGP